MNDWRDRWRGVLLVGLGNAWRAWLYTQRKRRWDDRAAPRGPLLTPGPLLEAEALPAGARFRFARAQLEVRFLAEGVVRCTWTPGRLPPPYALAETPPAEEEAASWVTLRREGEAWVLQGVTWRLTVAPEGLAWQAHGVTLRREAWPLRRGEGWIQTVTLPPQGPVLGLGLRAAGPNLRPGTYRLWNRDPGGAYGPGADPLYLSLPVLWVHRPAPGYLVFYENPYPGQVTLEGDRLQVAFTDGALRYYLFLGPAPEALARFTALTGRPPLPPRWALGLHQSRWGYRSQAEAAAVLEGYARHDIPLAALHLDIDYMDGFRVFTVDRARFPDLQALAEQAHAQGVRLVTILDPGVKVDPNYPLYRQGLAQGAFCTLPGGQPFHAPVWPGWCAFPDFTEPRVRAWWSEQYAFFVERQVDGVWHDMNEPSAFVAEGDPTFPLAVQHALEGEGGDHRLAHNLYGLLMNRAGYEALRRLRPDRRPWLLSRSGWVGVQRYAWNWTGDTESTWPALKLSVAQMLHLACSGVFFAGPDIGGFAGAPDGELFTRWFQLATFLPFFRIHSSRLSPPREPWRFGEPWLSIVRDFAHLRRRLLPYLYTLAWEAHHLGQPLVRPLWWLDPEDEALWEVDDAFLLGDALLVAPVTAPGLTRRPVRLPAGRWYNFWTGAPVDGGGVVLADAPPERIPVFVRAGAVLPLAEEGDPERPTLRVFLPFPGEVATGSLYLDAGDGYGPWRYERYTLRHTAQGWQSAVQATGEMPWSGPRRWVLWDGEHAEERTETP